MAAAPSSTQSQAQMFIYNHKNSLFNRGGQPSTPSSSRDRKYYTQELVLEAAQTLQRPGQQHAEHHAPAGCALKPANVQKGFSQRTAYPTGGGEQPQSTNAALNCKPAATHSNSGLLPFWGNPNATNPPRPYSSAQEVPAAGSLSSAAEPADAPQDLSVLCRKKSSDVSKEPSLLPTPLPATHLPPVPTFS